MVTYKILYTSQWEPRWFVLLQVSKATEEHLLSSLYLLVVSSSEKLQYTHQMSTEVTI